MDICLVGSLVPQSEYDKIVAMSKSKPSNAPENFQSSLAKGMTENQQGMSAVSFPAMASYPHGPYFIFREREYALNSYIKIKCPSFVNIPFLKQIGIYISTFLEVKKWIHESKEEQCFVILYSDYPPYARAARFACHNTKAKCVLLMTDLATYSYYPHKKNLYSFFKIRMEEMCKADYRKYDGYILLSKYMEQAMRIGGLPSVIMEGFSDISSFDFEEKKTDRKVFMYAGSLSKVYNIDVLIEAFQKTKMDADLWLFGSGEMEEKVKESAKQDSRIIFKGKVSREELLHAMKKANILINAKSGKIEHTKYAFPSKILEYMAAGTAVLTTKVAGIPDEYYPYLMTIEDESVDGIAKAIEKACELPESQLKQLGESAYSFVATEKNCKVQARKIIEFLSKL